MEEEYRRYKLYTIYKMASPNIASPEEVALNQAILASMQRGTVVQPALPPPTWNNQTQFIPVQTTTTYIPIPTPGIVRMPTIPGFPTQTPTRTPVAPIVPQPIVRMPIGPMALPARPMVPVPQMQQRPIVVPASPRTNLPPLQTVQLSPRSPLSPNLQRSPGRMTRDEEDQLRIAIMNSLQDPTILPPMIVRTPPRSPLQSPIIEEDDVEDELLQQAIQASITAAEQARLATFHANQVVAAPMSPRLLSPRTEQLMENRKIREEQDRAYEEALRIDTEKAENARKAAEAAARAAQAAEEAARKLQEAKIAEEAKREALQPPILKYPLEVIDMKDLYMLRFKLPNGSVVNHSFHRDEPLSSIIQQLRFDLKYLGDIVITVPPNVVLTCSPDTSIVGCGVANRTMLFVTYP